MQEGTGALARSPFVWRHDPGPGGDFVGAAASIEEAVALAGELNPDLIIVESSAEWDRDGVQDLIESGAQSIPVLVLNARAAVPIFLRCHRRHAWLYPLSGETTTIYFTPSADGRVRPYILVSFVFA